MHTCKALIIHCMDFRLMKPIDKYLNEHGLAGTCDRVALGGGILGLTERGSAHLASTLREQIELSAKLHGIETLILMNHTDCGAYGGHAAFASSLKEQERHFDDMAYVSKKLSALFAHLTLRTVLADIQEDGKISFIES